MINHSNLIKVLLKVIKIILKLYSRVDFKYSLLLKEISNIKKGEPIPLNQFSDLVSPIGFEPMTASLEGRCSIQLSYEPVVFMFLRKQCRSGRINIVDPDRFGYKLKIFLISKSLRFLKKVNSLRKLHFLLCRGGRIRTCDLLVPNEAR